MELLGYTIILMRSAHNECFSFLINSSLTKVRTYVNEEDGKIHFVDSTGADSVLPFSGKAYPYGSVGGR